jgi:hypothetical protein
MSQVRVTAQEPIAIRKTEATLMEVTTVSGGLAVSSPALDVGGQAHGIVFIDHAYLDTAASGVLGALYTIEVSQKASGNDNWRPYTTFRTALLTPSYAVTPNATHADGQPGETTISLASNGASGYTAGNKVFFQNNASFANSEWAEVVRSSQTTFVQLRDGLTYTQQSSYIFGAAEQYVTSMRLDDVERLRVTVNNALYTNTNKAIAFRARIIYGNA